LVGFFDAPRKPAEFRLTGWPADGGIAVGTMRFLLGDFVGPSSSTSFSTSPVRRSEFMSDAAVVAILAGGGVSSSSMGS
jgi:hypothetical protein